MIMSSRKYFLLGASFMLVGILVFSYLVSYRPPDSRMVALPAAWSQTDSPSPEQMANLRASLSARPKDYWRMGMELLVDASFLGGVGFVVVGMVRRGK